ncbi:MAG: ABC transporter ATP-binding protein [Candidatus Cohnella colombiensis]|uniref:ABC transporter ATP-binding protein n=1 Tax=Candidatus Cohnella colombiensis TaxID=3121368 RepID=A0AA95F0X7_9BACL|nr:MAG: ABC transporter ATP-binding protein [Cohnella sp.]
MSSVDQTQTKQKKTMKEIIDNNLFLLKFAYRNAPFFIFFTCFYNAFQSIVIYIEHTLGIKYITDAIQYHKPFSKVIQYIIFICVLIIVSIALGRWFWHVIQAKGLEKLNLALKTELYEKAAAIDLACYDDPEYYNEFVLSINEVNNQIKKLIDQLSKLCSSVALLFVVGGFFLFMDKVGLIFVAVVVISTLFVSMKVNKLRFEMRLAMNAVERKRSYMKRVFYLADYAKEIRLNRISPKLLTDFTQTNLGIREIVQQRSKKLIWYSFLQECVCRNLVLDGLYLLYICYMTLVKHAFSYGGAVALARSVWSLNESLQGLSGLVSQVQENSLYIAKIRKFMAYEQTVVEQEHPLEIPKQPGLLELNNVSFSYPSEEGYTLRNISLKIRPHEKIALVGYNGAGKTTLIKLLMRLYDVSDGQIRVDGKDIREYQLEPYRRSYGTVFQDYQLFAATIAQNVMMDEVAVPIREEQANTIAVALAGSGFTDRLDQMEHGIHTALTREFDESGTNLSGGEAQKIAIARVFAKSCPYIILDEPSSALDPISEYHMNQSMLDAAKDKTVIFISHRLSTTRMADRIYMLEHGQIIEEGTHDELMDLNGKYAEMFNLQAEKYRMVSAQGRQVV